MFWPPQPNPYTPYNKISLTSLNIGINTREMRQYGGPRKIVFNPILMPYSWWLTDTYLCGSYWGWPWAWKTRTHWYWPWYNWDYPNGGTLTREEDNVVFCFDLDSDTKMRVYVEEGDIVSLMSLDSNTVNIRFLGFFNGIRWRFDGKNNNGYSGPTHNKLGFPCILLVIFLSINSPPVNIKYTLEISLCLLYNFLDW